MGRLPQQTDRRLGVARAPALSTTEEVWRREAEIPQTPPEARYRKLKLPTKMSPASAAHVTREHVTLYLSYLKTHDFMVRMVFG
jgi:hypothetical protein